MEANKLVARFETCLKVMDDIRYSRNRVIYVSCPCALGLALRNVRNIFILQMALVVLTIITKLKLRWISVTD